MKLRQAFNLAWSSIIGNKMRSFLTMLGMIIGVASVIALISLMQGMQNQMTSSFESFGTNSVTVSLIGRNGDIVLDVEDMYDYAEKNSEHIVGVTPNISFGASLNYKSEQIEQTSITGVAEDYDELNYKTLEKGRFIHYTDVKNREKVCVIGSYIDLKLFNREAEIGTKLKINGMEYTIVGILKEESNSIEWSGDNSLYIPYTTACREANIRDITNFSIHVDDSVFVEQITSEIQEFLYSVYHDEDAYRVTNMIDFLKEFNLMLGMMTAVLTGIAGISLLVAGIGIMNIMLVSVTERTKEIGIRKSLGAKKRDIMRQFVLEAGATSSIGGVIGIILGSFGATSLGKIIGMDATPTVQVILIAFGISAGIGVAFGYLPANKAAKLNPIDALRNE